MVAWCRPGLPSLRAGDAARELNAGDSDRPTAAPSDPKFILRPCKWSRESVEVVVRRTKRHETNGVQRGVVVMSDRARLAQKS